MGEAHLRPTHMRPLGRPRRSGEKALDSLAPMLHLTDDLRIERIRPLIPPAILMENLPLSERASTTVAESRERGRALLRGDDDRLVVVVGPCSIHDVTAALEYAQRAAGARSTELARRALRGDAGLLREAAHDRRLEGADQRPAPRRHVRDQRGAAHRARPAAGPGRAGPARRLRVPRHDHAAVHRRPGELGRDRRAHHREPGAPRAGLGPVDAGRLQERHRRQHRRSPSTPSTRPATRTISCRSPSRGWRRSWPRAATPTATSSCAAPPAARTTKPSPVARGDRLRWRRPGCAAR